MTLRGCAIDPSDRGWIAICVSDTVSRNIRTEYVSATRTGGADIRTEFEMNGGDVSTVRDTYGNAIFERIGAAEPTEIYNITCPPHGPY